MSEHPPVVEEPALAVDRPSATGLGRSAGDVWGSALTVVASAVALERSVSYGFRGDTQVVGPGMYPGVISAVMVVLGLVWAWQAFRRSVPQPEEAVIWPDATGYIRIGTTVATLVAAALLFEVLDFRITIFAITFVILRFVFSQPLVLAIITGIAMSAICYFGLSVGLGMVLPLFAF